MTYLSPRDTLHNYNNYIIICNYSIITDDIPVLCYINLIPSLYSLNTDTVVYMHI